jgi:hypothetical protein
MQFVLGIKKTLELIWVCRKNDCLVWNKVERMLNKCVVLPA